MQYVKINVWQFYRMWNKTTQMANWHFLKTTLDFILVNTWLIFLSFNPYKKKEKQKNEFSSSLPWLDLLMTEGGPLCLE